MSLTLELGLLFAGSLTLLSPCVLPIIPFVASASLKEHKLGPIFLGLGLVLSFSITTFIIARSGSFLGLEAQQLKYFSGCILLISSLLFLFPKFLDYINAQISPFLQKIININLVKVQENKSKNTLQALSSEFLNGVFLGPVWAPCSGPSLGIVMGLLATESSHFKALYLLMYFATGALTPLVIISYGAQKIVYKMKTLGLANAQRIKFLVGSLGLTMSLLILTGFDKKLEIFILSITPEFFINLSTYL